MKFIVELISTKRKIRENFSKAAQPRIRLIMLIHWRENYGQVNEFPTQGETRR